MGRSHSAGLLNSEVETTYGTKNVNQLLSRLYIKPLSLFLLSVNKDAILLHVRIPEALWKIQDTLNLCFNSLECDVEVYVLMMW